MRKEKPQNTEVGAKLGKLTILYKEWRGSELLLVCGCDCMRIVRGSAKELTARPSCISCAESDDLKRFAHGDVVVYLNAIGDVPFGSQAIVNRILEKNIEIEYRGRFYAARPGELENLGVNFYDRRRFNKKRSGR